MMSHYSRDTLHWVSYDGRKILIKDLDVRHLVNILNHIKTANDNRAGVYPPDVCLLLEAEGELRIMLGWAKDTGIPRKNEDGTWELINQTAHEEAVGTVLTHVHQQRLKESRNQRLSELELFKKYMKFNNLQHQKSANKGRPLTHIHL